MVSAVERGDSFFESIRVVPRVITPSLMFIKRRGFLRALPPSPREVSAKLAEGVTPPVATGDSPLGEGAKDDILSAQMKFT